METSYIPKKQYYSKPQLIQIKLVVQMIFDVFLYLDVLIGIFANTR